MRAHVRVSVCADYQVNLPMSVCETFHCRCVCSCLVRFISADLSKDQGNQLASQRKRNIIETLVHIKSCTFQLLILSSSFNLFSKISSNFKANHNILEHKILSSDYQFYLTNNANILFKIMLKFESQ